jgi:hypothetical protein
VLANGFTAIVKAEIADDFSAADWQLVRKNTGQISLSPGRLRLRDNPGGSPRTMAAKAFDVDLDINPIFSVKVTSLTQEAEIKLIRHSTREKRRIVTINAPGIYNVNIKEKLGWQGHGKITVWLYASGNEAEIEYAYVKFTNKPEPAYKQKKFENLISDSSFESQSSYRPTFHLLGEYRLNEKDSKGISLSNNEQSHGKRSLRLEPGASWTYDTTNRFAAQGVFAADLKSTARSDITIQIAVMPLNIHGGSTTEITEKTIEVGTQWKRIETSFHNKHKSWSTIYSVRIHNTSKTPVWVDAVQLELETLTASAYRPGRVSLRKIDQMGRYTFSAASDSVKSKSANASGEVNLTVAIPDDLSGELSVCGGVPFPKGALFQPSGVNLYTANGKQIPLQTTVLARRNTDGSIVSLLLDFTIDATHDKRQRCLLRYGAATKNRETRANLARYDGARIIIDNGVVRAKLDPAHFRVFDQIQRISDGLTVEAGALDGAFFTGIDGNVYASSQQKPTTFKIERNGPEHTVILVRGKHATANLNPLLAYETRIHVFKNKEHFLIEHSIINQETPPDMIVRNIGLRLPAAAGHQRVFGMANAPDLAFAAGSGQASVTQVKNCFGSNDYDVLLQRSDSVRETLPNRIADGSATNGISAVAVKDFMELNPRELSLGKGYVSAYIWPENGVKDLSIPFGFATTMRLYYAPFGGDKETIAKLAKGNVLLQSDREWISKSNVFVPFIPIEEKRKLFPRAAARDDTVFELYRKFQTVSDFNGLFNYGDSGSPSYCSNHETEGVDNYWIRYLRDASADSFKLAESATLHSRDVDVCHIRDRVAARHTHCAFTHTSYHFHTGHFWQSGLLWHYLLTGDRRSFEVALASAAELVTKSSINYKAGRERSRILFHLAELYGLTGITQFRKSFEKQVDFGAGSNIGHSYYSGLSLEALMKLYDVTGEKKYWTQLVADAGKCLADIDELSRANGDIHIGEGRIWYIFKAMGNMALLTGNPAYITSLSSYFLPYFTYSFLLSDYSLSSGAPFFKAMRDYSLSENTTMPEHLFGIDRLSGSMPGRGRPNAFKFEIPGGEEFTLRVFKQLKYRYYSQMKYKKNQQPRVDYRLVDPNGKLIEKGHVAGTDHECNVKTIRVENTMKGNYSFDLAFTDDCWGAFSCSVPARLDARRWFACRNSNSKPLAFWLKAPEQGKITILSRWKFGNNKYAGKILGAALETRQGELVTRQIWTIPMDWRNDANSKYCTKQLELDIPDHLRGKTLQLLINGNKWLEWQVNGLDLPWLGAEPSAINARNSGAL